MIDNANHPSVKITMRMSEWPTLANGLPKALTPDDSHRIRMLHCEDAPKWVGEEGEPLTMRLRPVSKLQNVPGVAPKRARKTLTVYAQGEEDC